MALSKDDIHALQTMMETLLHRELTPIRADIRELKETTETLKADVAELKEDVAILKADLAELKEPNAEHKGTSENLRSAIKALTISQNEMKEEIRILNYQMKRNTQSINDLRLDLNIFKDAVCREFHSINDKLDTVIEVLRERELLPQ